MAGYKHFHVARHNDVSVVHLTDTNLLDRLIISGMQDELLELIKTDAPKKLLVDFGAVTHCPSEVITGLLRTRKRLTPLEGELKICGMRDQIREVFKMMNLDGTVFHIYDTADEAMAAF
jgi:anti-anti-sigma factor